MVRPAVSLIKHVQDLLNPLDRMPEAPDLPDDFSPNIEPVEHPRPRVPDWVPRNPEGTIWVRDDEELIIEGEGDVDVDADGDLSGLADSVARQPAIDVYAYYLPYHFYSNNWGIYIRASGVLAIAAHVCGHTRSSKISSFELNSIFRLLLEHEAFHHRVELACTRGELPLLNFLPSSPSTASPYEWYFWDPRAGLHEEAMANAHAMRELEKWQRQTGFLASQQRDLLYRVSKFMESQPPGYRDFAQWEGDREFRDGKDEVINHFWESTFLRAISTPPQGLVSGRNYFADTRIPWCPIYLVKDAASRHVRIGRPFPKEFGMRVVVHTHEHPPPHFHLEYPIGNEIGRYGWPNRDPLPGASQLSGSDRKKLDRYLDMHESAINNKIAEVYKTK